MNSRDDAEYRQRLEAKLQPARVRSTLEFAALFQLTHEMLKRAVLDDVKGFYGYVDIDEGVWIPEDGRTQYAEHVLTRAPGRPFEASLLWLQDSGALSGEQVGQLQTIYTHRHALTHELAKYLIDPDLEPDYELFIEALKTLREIMRFWVQIEKDIGTFEAYGDVDIDQVVPARMALLDLCLRAFTDGAPSAESS